jgi:hypothetical protein
MCEPNAPRGIIWQSKLPERGLEVAPRDCTDSSPPTCISENISFPECNSLTVAKLRPEGPARLRGIERHGSATLTRLGVVELAFQEALHDFGSVRVNSFPT